MDSREEKKNLVVCTRIIIALSLLLILFPLLAMTEFLENIFVSFIGFLVGIFALRMRYKLDGKIDVSTKFTEKIEEFFSAFKRSEECGEKGERKEKRKLHDILSQGSNNYGEAEER